VIESEGTPLRVPYQYYHAQKEFRQLTGWLRSKGVNFPRPLHTLREEFGSQICLHHGIHAEPPRPTLAVSGRDDGGLLFLNAYGKSI
jgi:hypothetical protein